MRPARPALFPITSARRVERKQRAIGTRIAPSADRQETFAGFNAIERGVVVELDLVR